MTAGRPTTYTQELADKICSQLSDGISLRTVCKDEDMPSKTTVFSWMRKYPEFLDQYTRAKEESADAMTEDMMDIADDGHNDWMEKYYGDDVVWVENKEAIARSRLRVETRKWLASKMKPKKYGEAMKLSGDDESPLSFVVKIPGSPDKKKKKSSQ